MNRLSSTHRVVAPNLRGIGGTTRTAAGYDIETLARDASGLLDALGIDSATVVGIDAGVQVAVMLALQTPSLVDRLALMEGLIGGLPGAEEFLAKGPPWWFGFHAVPGLAETIVQGREAEYIDWFLVNGTADKRGVDPQARDAFVAAYRGAEALRSGFEHYRNADRNAEQIEKALGGGRFAMPTMAIEGGLVGATVSKQLKPISTHFSRSRIEDCGHLVPLEQPDSLAAVIRRFAA
jgi:pimeloyl-ACP methyl ester carboxylesterase